MRAERSAIAVACCRFYFFTLVWCLKGYAKRMKKEEDSRKPESSTSSIAVLDKPGSC